MNINAVSMTKINARKLLNSKQNNVSFGQCQTAECKTDKVGENKEEIIAGTVGALALTGLIIAAATGKLNKVGDSIKQMASKGSKMVDDPKTVKKAAQLELQDTVSDLTLQETKNMSQHEIIRAFHQ